MSYICTYIYTYMSIGNPSVAAPLCFSDQMRCDVQRLAALSQAPVRRGFRATPSAATLPDEAPSRSVRHNPQRNQSRPRRLCWLSPAMGIMKIGTLLGNYILDILLSNCVLANIDCTCVKICTLYAYPPAMYNIYIYIYVHI